jgi:hypothetical protein
MSKPFKDHQGLASVSLHANHRRQKTNFSSLFPVCWQFSEQKIDFPTEGATFVALKAWYQYVSGKGTHAQEGI